VTAYVPNHEKKLRLLAKREGELRRAIDAESTTEKLEKCADRVRAARLAVFKMKFSKNSVLPAHSYQPDQEALKWISMKSSEIVEIYRKGR